MFLLYLKILLTIFRFAEKVLNMDSKIIALMCLTFCFVPETVYAGKHRLRNGKHIGHLRNDIKIQSKYKGFIENIYFHVCYKTIANCKSDFIDSESFNCNAYLTEKWCSPNGGYGENWDNTWGTISDWGSDGYDALDCPECGCGGSKSS